MKIEITDTSEMSFKSPTMCVETTDESLHDILDIIGGMLITYGYAHSAVCRYLNTEKYNNTNEKELI